MSGLKARFGISDQPTSRNQLDSSIPTNQISNPLNLFIIAATLNKFKTRRLCFEGLFLRRIIAQFAFAISSSRLPKD